MIEIDTSLDESTVILKLAVTFESATLVAVIVALPAVIPLTSPFSTIATEGSELLNVTALSVASSGITLAIGSIISLIPMVTDPDSRPLNKIFVGFISVISSRLSVNAFIRKFPVLALP